MKGFGDIDRSQTATASSKMLSSEANTLAFESLRQNEFFPMQSYEAFLSKKYRIGKKTLFLNRDLTEEAKENMMEHIRVAEQKKQAKVQGRIEELAEQKRESELNSEQLKEMKSTELAMKKNLIKTNI